MKRFIMTLILCLSSIPVMTTDDKTVTVIPTDNGPIVFSSRESLDCRSPVGGCLLEPPPTE